MTPGIVPTKKYYPGIFYAMFWSAATLATQAEQTAAAMAGARRRGVLDVHRRGVRGVLHRAARGDADRPADPGRHQRAGRSARARGGDHARQHRRQRRARAARAGRRGRADRGGLQGAQQSSEVDAVVFDAPVLLYYAANEGKGRVHMVGTPFRKEDYGIVFRPRQSAAPAGQRGPPPAARRRHLPADLRQVVRQPDSAPRHPFVRSIR